MEFIRNCKTILHNAFFGKDRNVKIRYSILFFRICNNGINISTLLKEKFEERMIARWVYLVLPILFEGILFAAMIITGVFYKPGKFSYLRDVSNSFVLTVLFLLSYYLPGYYNNKVEYCFRSCIDDEYKKKLVTDDYYERNEQRRYYRFILDLIALAVGAGAGIGFLIKAGSSESAFWIRELYENNIIGIALYSLFLTFTWYHSLLLLGMVLSGGFAIHGLLKEDKIKYSIRDYNRNESIRTILDISICNFSYGLFYIGGSIVFIVNDNVSSRFLNVESAFSNPLLSLGLICFVLAIVLLTFVPLQTLYEYMAHRRTELLKDLDERIEQTTDADMIICLENEKKEIATSGVLFTTLSNRIVILLSLMIPIIGVILQIIQLLVDVLKK